MVVIQNTIATVGLSPNPESHSKKAPSRGLFFFLSGAKSLAATAAEYLAADRDAAPRKDEAQGADNIVG